ncbi:MAG: nodulation protein NfeD [Planctomycetota bacterium]
MPVFYTSGLTVFCYALIVAEFFVPSGGLLGIAATLAGISALLIAFTHSLSFGITMTGVFVVTIPSLFALIVRIWPRTPVGREMLNRSPDSATNPPRDELKTIDGVPLNDLVGRIGTATTNCLPSGQIIVDGHRANAVSLGQPIDTGMSIKVVRVVAGQVQIRIADRAEIEEDAAEDVDEDAATLDSTPTTPGSPRIPRSTSSSSTASSLEEIDLDNLTSGDS